MATTLARLYFDDIDSDGEWESQGRTITETDIVNFAGLSGDYNSIHVDHEYAKTTPFRRPIAHGFLVFAIGSGLGVLAPPTHVIALVGVQEWNFVGPVFIGDTIRVRARVVQKTLKGRGRRGEIVWYRAIINQEDKIIQEGRVVTLVEARTGQSRSRGEQAIVTDSVGS